MWMLLLHFEHTRVSFLTKFPTHFIELHDVFEKELSASCCGGEAPSICTFGDDFLV